MLKIQDLADGCDIAMIAHSASQICRWRGRYRWISLAEHLCNVFDILVGRFEGEHIDTKRLALLHDACEVVGFGDVISPLKPFVTIYHDNKISTLRDFECELTKALMLKFFNVQYANKVGEYIFDKAQVKDADKVALELEKIYNDCDGLESALERTDVRIRGWGSKRAESEFLARYEQVKA